MSNVQGQSRTSATGAVRRRPSPRDVRIDALVGAALDELREHGYEGLTVRNAARRAGLAPATAYTYFGSKDHLVAEVFWRRVQLLPPPSSTSSSAATRLTVALDELIEVVVGEPALVAASTPAVLAADPDVEVLREQIGVRLDGHLAAALGADADPAVLRALNLAVSGALLQAGMGFLAFEHLGPRLHEVAHLLLGRR
jgi:AcrR family transcriptional regulator